MELLFSLHPVDLGDQTRFPELAASPLLLASQPWNICYQRLLHMDVECIGLFCCGRNALLVMFAQIKRDICSVL